MYDELDYLTSDVLNYIENRVVDLYNHYSNILSESYTPKEWNLNEFVYVDDIKRIEDGIDVVGKNFGYPKGWVQKKNWDLRGNENISYRDLNRWIKNIDFLINKNYMPLLPSIDLLPSDTLIPTNKRSVI